MNGVGSPRGVNPTARRHQSPLSPCGRGDGGEGKALHGAGVSPSSSPPLTSIPSLLSVFQEEWDALALETYTLQQNLAQTRRELSAALYQHDAAVRVIARLTKERDEARDALSKVTVGATRAGAGGEAMQVDSAALPQAVVEIIENTQARYVTSDVLGATP